jgi:hypothetical protein
MKDLEYQEATSQMKNNHDEKGHIHSFIQKVNRMKDLRISRGYFSNEKQP